AAASASDHVARLHAVAAEHGTGEQPAALAAARALGLLLDSVAPIVVDAAVELGAIALGAVELFLVGVVVIFREPGALSRGYNDHHGHSRRGCSGLLARSRVCL